MKNEMKYVDIIMPNYNKGNDLKKSVNSVINQTYKFWKLYIIDDGSEDNSIAILKKFEKNKKIKIIFLKKNRGPSYCRNIGLKLSKSKVICFLDSDDYWESQKIKKQLFFMKKNNHDFIYSDYYYKKKSIQYKTNITNFFNFEKFILNSGINTSTIMIKKKIFKKIKFKNSPFEDYIFKCDIFKKGFLAHKSSYISAHYIKSKNSRSKNKFKNLINLFSVNKRFIKLSFFSNIKSVIFISMNYLKKY